MAIGCRDELVIFGDDYPTPDGTFVCDDIHVEDLASVIPPPARPLTGSKGPWPRQGHVRRPLTLAAGQPAWLRGLSE